MSTYTRREFAKLSFGALPAAGLFMGGLSVRAGETPTPTAKPNSKIARVQLGLNVPYSFSNPVLSGADILARCLQLGISAVELRAQPVEAFLGLPSSLLETRRNVTTGEAGTKAAPVDPAAAKATAAALRQWRASASLARVAEFRNQYETAGVLIEILKVDGIYALTDDVLDYHFAMAKALGARAISCEISAKEEDLKRVGQFADQHRCFVGYHGHAATMPAHWERAFALAKYNAANLDLGHFVAGNETSPLDFIQQHHDRITHIHVKDRKKHGGPNTPFGEGDTPIVEALRLIRDNRWNIQATIEFEYRIPAGSDRMAEIARALKYCRDALV